jgi:hypothetical protein
MMKRYWSVGLLALYASLASAQLTDQDVERLKARSATPPPGPIPTAPIDHTIGPTHCWKMPLMTADGNTAEIDCATGKVIAVTPLPVNPFQGRSTELMVHNFPLHRVHTRSRNQDMESHISIDLVKGTGAVPAGKRVCAVRVQRISDIGNGNKWRAYFLEGASDVLIRYRLKARNWRTDSDLAAQTFAISAYYLPAESYEDMKATLDNPEAPRPSALGHLDGWIRNGIRCAGWSDGNDPFVPAPPKPKKPRPTFPVPLPQYKVMATGQYRCLDSHNMDAGVSSQGSTTADTCAAARLGVEGYLEEKDRCRYAANGNFPDRHWDRRIEWLQTTTCPIQ